jgi:hypothetical protein
LTTDEQKLNNIKAIINKLESRPHQDDTSLGDILNDECIEIAHDLKEAIKD